MSTSALPDRRRTAVLAVAATLAGGLLSLLHPATPAAASNPSEWMSATGNTVANIAKVIGANSSATGGLTGKGVGIALIDTGVVPVPGLPASQIVNGPDLSFESQSGSLRYLDTYGHGTHLAGIIVGNDATNGLTGIAPQAKLTSIKVGAADGAVDVSQVIAGLDWVVAHRNDDPANPIRVICLAYGTDSKPLMDSDPLLLAVENAGRAGILVVVAAGNSGTALGQVNSPAIDPYVLTVGSAATGGTQTQADDQVSSFTSLNTTDKVDVVVPGEYVVSLRNPGGSLDLAYPNARVGTTMFRGSGSSQAAAAAAGAAALLFQKAPQVTPIGMREWLRSTAVPLTGPNASRAYGEISLRAALQIDAPTRKGQGSGSDGTGSIESSRGDTHLRDGSDVLQGNESIFGPFDSSAWATASTNGTAWKGGVWMGYRMAGDGWTGTSWASKTWGAATWAGTAWDNQSWSDPSWSGHYWSGHYWSGNDWTGHYWSGGSWKVGSWG